MEVMGYWLGVIDNFCAGGTPAPMTFRKYPPTKSTPKHPPAPLEGGRIKTNKHPPAPLKGGRINLPPSRGGGG